MLGGAAGRKLQRTFFIVSFGMPFFNPYTKCRQNFEFLRNFWTQTPPQAAIFLAAQANAAVCLPKGHCACGLRPKFRNYLTGKRAAITSFCDNRVGKQSRDYR
ncbi:MAG: hypothetical protein DBX55_09975 [Verrucomicrobia bacterium]|nr:MAG: hypothetical protein DBX55_09975 [Verrucomicrobiota bacterium]